MNVGDRVKLSSLHSSWNDSPNNPLWEGSQGKVVGTIISTSKKFKDDLYNIRVRWDNNTINSYFAHHLTTIKPIKGVTMRETITNITTAVKQKTNTVVSAIEPYKSYIFLAALLLAMDYFIFNGAYTEKIKSLLTKVASNIMDTLEKLVDQITGDTGKSAVTKDAEKVTVTNPSTEE